MNRRRALVAGPRLPELDRDRGAQRVDGLIQFLLDDAWSVTFLSRETAIDQRHAHRLRQAGVATFAGFDAAPELIRTGRYDLALLAWWEPAEALLPVIREMSPDTRIMIDTIDLHFLRDARRLLGVEGRLDEAFGAQLVRELNTYRAADAVLAVSDNEAALLRDVLDGSVIEHLPLDETADRSRVPYVERRGLLFVGNFRHLPNGEAVEYLCQDVVPRLPPSLLAEHPLRIVGSWLNDSVRAHAAGLANVHIVGWVPSVVPYIERASASVVPLLHGAGVKGKVIQSLMIGTPVVSTLIGAEGLQLVDHEHALVGDGAPDLARAIEEVLTDERLWHRLADAGRAHAEHRHHREHVRGRFLEILQRVLARPPLGEASTPAPEFRHSRRRQDAYRTTVAAVCSTVRSSTEPGSIVCVVSRGDDNLLAVDGRTAWHFPQGRDGGWIGYHPADGQEAIDQLAEHLARGARYLAIPSVSFWWLHHYRELADHLDREHTLVARDDDVVLYALGRSRAGVDRPDAVVQRTQSWTVQVDDRADVRDGLVDDLLRLGDELGCERIQAAHHGGADAGPPATERVRGCVARILPEPLDLPVLAVRDGAPSTGSTVVADVVSVGLREPLDGPRHGDASYPVSDVIVHGPGGRPEPGVRRSGDLPRSPAISVLIATYDRPDLLAGCLEAFCAQTVERDAFEIVVVDDGSPGPETAKVLDGYLDHLPLSHVRIDHAGRSAAKNLAVMLARAPLVLFFDDDDRPAPDLLTEHLRAHALHSADHDAVLGHTDCAPDLPVTPLMHYLTEVDQVLFAYGHLHDGQVLDWRGFWEGRVSCKRALLMRHGLHDQRLEYSIDVELALRLAAAGLAVHYWPSARSVMSRPIELDDFCARSEGKGRALAWIAAQHPTADVARYVEVVGGAGDASDGDTPDPDALVARIRALGDELSGSSDWRSDRRLGELHRGYRTLHRAFTARGVRESSTLRDDRFPRTAAPEGAVEVSVVIAVWSRTPELADMAMRTVERIWEVARLRTEVVVVDNGSPHQRPLRARLHRFGTNRGVATAWNTGIGLARAPVVVVLNSDCTVEPGWDEALYEAATTGRRIAFPYTDHGDGQGFREPDQAGTAGWCFALSKEVFDEVGPFDELFNPAYGEDTDYWHRAWQLGIELSPVPAARVSHVRRTTAGLDPNVEWLLTGHRYVYGWKHGVEPLKAPPYYHRPIVAYHVSGLVPEASR